MGCDRRSRPQGSRVPAPARRPSGRAWCSRGNDPTAARGQRCTSRNSRRMPELVVPGSWINWKLALLCPGPWPADQQSSHTSRGTATETPQNPGVMVPSIATPGGLQSSQPSSATSPYQRDPLARNGRHKDVQPGTKGPEIRALTPASKKSRDQSPPMKRSIRAAVRRAPRKSARKVAPATAFENSSGSAISYRDRQTPVGPERGAASIAAHGEPVRQS